VKDVLLLASKPQNKVERPGRAAMVTAARRYAAGSAADHEYVKECCRCEPNADVYSIAGHFWGRFG
jgi:hypothetical protein